MPAWAKLALLGALLVALSTLADRRTRRSTDASPPSEMRMWAVASTAVLGVVLVLTAIAIGLIV